MRSYKDKTIWITGASSGIGEATAYRFAQEGAKLILTARNAEKLEAVGAKCLEEGAAGVTILPADLEALLPNGPQPAAAQSTPTAQSAPAGQLATLENLAAQAWGVTGRIDLFFANAGISQRCETLDADLALIERIMNLDYYVPVALTKALLPRMIEAGGGQLAVTSSIAGEFGAKQRSAYCSAKAAVKLFYETVGLEYYDKGIRTTVIIPGRVRTNISYTALEKGGKPHGQMDQGQAKGISPEKAARKIYRALAREKQEQLVGGGELLMVWIKRLFPRLAFRISRALRP